MSCTAVDLILPFFTIVSVNTTTVLFISMTFNLNVTTAVLDKIGRENKVTGEYFIYLFVAYLMMLSTTQTI
jgi:hypothetical protein